MKTAAELKGQMLVAKVCLHNYRAPKHNIEAGAYAIVVLDLIKVIEGEIPQELEIRGCPGEYRFIAKGRMPKLERDEEYIFTGKLVVDPEWGAQYNCESIYLGYDMNSEIDQRKFFSYFLTDRQIDGLFELNHNPIALLESSNIGELTKIKGIGKVTATRMCLKYKENKNNGRAYVALKELNLTKNAIDRLIEQFGSADAVVDIIEENPYSLIKLVKGYGWEKCDAIALKQGFSTDSKERVLAYATYHLNEQADVNGNSCVGIEELINAVLEVCKPIDRTTAREYLVSVMWDQTQFDEYYSSILENPRNADRVENPLFFYSKEERKVGLFSLRILEKKIVTHLQRLQESPHRTKFDRSVCEKIIAETEKEQGWEYTIEQKSAIWNILDDNVSILTGSAGCVDCDTEYFNGKDWKRIADYTKGEKVLMYNEDGTASLVEPSDYVKYPADQLWLTQTKYGLDMCLSDEHNVYYITSKGNLCHNSFSNIKKMHEESFGGFSGKFITSFKYGGSGIDLTDNEIKLMLAVICDGNFTNHSNNTNYCRFHIKKDRKKLELRKIFKEGNFKYKETESATSGYTDFYCYAPRHEKVFTDYWYNCSLEQLKLICNNILFWDGNGTTGRKRFSSSVKDNADFVQFAFSATGYKATIQENNRIGKEFITAGKSYTRKSTEYNVSISERNLVSIGGFHKTNLNKTKIIPYTTKDGYKYCFTVPTHMWVMRRNGKIVVTGNTGKSSTLRPLIRIFQHYGLVVDQTALSGRASSLLSEITELDGKTIHRLLCYDPESERFTRNEHNPLSSDVVILDETSMVGEELFLSLISAMKTGTKLIMLGDVKQLPPMAVGNILNDCIQSGYIRTNVLTLIQRQALQSGIIAQSIFVCQGQSIVKNGFIGEETRGELKDFKLICNLEPALVHNSILREFERLYNSGVDKDDIQIVVPVRLNGENSCRVLNEEVQQIVNGDPDSKAVTLDYKEGTRQYSVTFKCGDRIIVNKNNYHAIALTGEEIAIFNGNIGHIVDIGSDYMVLDFPEQGNVLLPKEDWWNINLAYAITCHKLQGSQSPYCIIGMDYSAYILLTREWLYTALTRAKKYCILAGQPKAINTAIRTSSIKQKQTWLLRDLYELYLATIDDDGSPEEE